MPRFGGTHIRVAGLVHRPVASMYVRVLVLCICLAGWCLPACAEGQNDLAPASQTDRLGAAPSVHLASSCLLSDSLRDALAVLAIIYQV